MPEQVVETAVDVVALCDRIKEIDAEIGTMYATTICSFDDESAAAPLLSRLYAQQQAIEDRIVKLPPPATLTEAIAWARIAGDDWLNEATDLGGVAARRAIKFLVNTYL